MQIGEFAHEQRPEATAEEEETSNSELVFGHFIQ